MKRFNSFGFSIPSHGFAVENCRFYFSGHTILKPKIKLQLIFTLSSQIVIKYWWTEIVKEKDCLIYNLCQTFEPIIWLSTLSFFVRLWGCKSIYRPLSYPLWSQRKTDLEIISGYLDVLSSWFLEYMLIEPSSFKCICALSPSYFHSHVNLQASNLW